MSYSARVGGMEFAVSQYSTLTYLEVDDEGTEFYVARHPELPGCLAQGDTPEEARASLEEARELYLEALAEAGLPAPQPLVLPKDQERLNELVAEVFTS